MAADRRRCRIGRRLGDGEIHHRPGRDRTFSCALGRRIAIVSILVRSEPAAF